MFSTECWILVCASEMPRSGGRIAASRILARLWRQVRRGLGVFRGSRLGIAGLTIVLIFAFIGVLAPVISPYPRTFEAPQSDRFAVSAYSRVLPPGLTYGEPVMGPTTPTYADRQGGMWVVNYAREGFIFMDFARHTLQETDSPFDAGNLSLSFDIKQDFTFAPQPSDPLWSVFYIVPAENSTSEQGTGRQTGALAFFANRDFYVVNPFTGSLLFWAPLNFDPVWTGEDPASAGEMVLLPEEFRVELFPGDPAAHDTGPHRYFWAAGTANIAVLEIDYVHPTDPTGVSGRIVVSEAASLSAPPFVYYNQGKVAPGDEYRAGSGQAILVPLANQTLEVRDVTGAIRRWVPLTLAGLPAVVEGDIGFVRSPDASPLKVFLPLRSASAVGIVALELSTLSLTAEYSIPNPGWQSLGRPTSYLGLATYFAFFDPSDGPGGTTHLLRVNATGAPTAQFHGVFSGRMRHFYEVRERSKIFVFPGTGGIYMMTTAFATNEAVVPERFPVSPDLRVDLFRYAGALGGTLYAIGLTQQELYGTWLDAQTGELVLHQLLGTIQTPLPPGTYPSGNRYLLGTDFRGSDILTQIFWGTQVAFIVGLLAALFAVGVGTIVGLLAGYYGKLIDTLLMRMTDIFLVLPFLPIVLVLASILRPSIWVIILVLGIVGWPGIARVIRAQVLTLKERPFVDAARVSGASDLRLIFYQIAPNVLPFSFLYMSLGVAGAIVTEAALSFLGLGDVTVISWGGTLSQVLTFGGALSAWWWLLPPGLAITALSLGFYLVGRGFDEIINPRLRRR